MPATNIPDGYGLIPGRSPALAGKVLAAADAAGVPTSVVRTTDEGYLAPLAVLDEFDAMDQPKPAEKPAEKAPPKEPAKRASSRKKKE
jgi:hypothetical protein